jgi:hypothetical protein
MDDTEAQEPNTPAEDIAGAFPSKEWTQEEAQSFYSRLIETENRLRATEGVAGALTLIATMGYLGDVEGDKALKAMELAVLFSGDEANLDDLKKVLGLTRLRLIHTGLLAGESKMAQGRELTDCDCNICQLGATAHALPEDVQAKARRVPPYAAMLPVPDMLDMLQQLLSSNVLA